MIFIYGKWDAFCKRLQQDGIVSIPAEEVTGERKSYLVLKHDVETAVSHALKMAQIEHQHGHRGTYYVQAYLLEDAANVEMLQQMQALGHEISYHYDVMDSCHGNLDAAVAEFEKNRSRFIACGFPVTTVCQHGNPVAERVGYTSNRDFFRSSRVQALYPGVADIMVDYPEKYKTEYLYFSDAGRIFKKIFDPINNDIIDSDDKNTPYADLDALFSGLSREVGNIISTHPHRWTDSPVKYVVKNAVFKVVKGVARVLLRIPIMKKIMSRFYFLAKKF